MKSLYLLVILAATFPKSLAIIGYDCVQKFTNFTTYSLVNIGECDLPSPIVDESTVKATVLQINDYSTTMVRYCKIQIKRTIFYCGMHHHISTIRNSEAEYIKEISREECENMHIHRSFKLYDDVLDNLLINDTSTRILTIAGSQSFEGHCSPVPKFSDPFGDYYDVIVQGYVHIRLEERWNSIDLNNNKIRLEFGTTCAFSDGHCIDSSLGYAFWNTMPLHVCQEEKYTNLYTGSMTKIVDRDTSLRALYVAETDQMSFAFKDKGEVILCSFKLIKTEHPKLFILLDPDVQNFEAKKTKLMSNLDMFAYINSKFLYVEKHSRKQMYQLYQDVLRQRCELERKVIANALGLATVSPDLLAYQLMGGPGYISLLAGEVIHVLKCVPVEVTIRELPDCYQELPVKKGEKDMFLSPRTHILKEFGTPTVCDRNLPVIYQFGDSWIKLMPTVTSHEQPLILKPQTKQSWKYNEPANLATTDLYTYEDIENLKTYIMFPSERSAVLNQLALSATGKRKNSGTLSMNNFLDENTLNRIAESTWDRIWGKFITFGSASAAFLTILMIFRLIKFALDTIIHGYALHSIYGWSLHLLGALWNSLTHLLLYLGRPLTETSQREGGVDSSVEQPPTAPNSVSTISDFNSQVEVTNKLQSNNSTIFENKLYPILEEPNISALNKHTFNSNNENNV